MALQGIGRTVVGLAVLTLHAVAAGAWQPNPRDALGSELARQERQRRMVQKLLGRDRWRRLDIARFDIRLHNHPFTPDLADHQYREELVSGILLQTVVKLSQKSVERRLRLYECRDSLRGRLRGVDRSGSESRADRPGVRVSPRFRLGERAWLGAKLRLTGADSGLLSRTSLRLGSEIDGQDASVKLAFRTYSRQAMVVYHTDHRKRGEALEFQLGFSF